MRGALGGSGCRGGARGGVVKLVSSTANQSKK